MPRTHSRNKKRSFACNQYTQKSEDHLINKQNSASGSLQPASNSSSGKIKFNPIILEDKDDYNIIINFGLLKSLFEEIASCSDCGNNIKVENNEIRQQGFCLELKLSCA